MKLLLSATPFQLEPRQWNGLAKHLIGGRHRVFSRSEIRSYVEKVDPVFRNPTNELGPTSREVNEASSTLRKLATRTLPKRSRRRYGR
jgi:hypothetical protein